jgi:hypothetical protein
MSSLEPQESNKLETTTSRPPNSPTLTSTQGITPVPAAPEHKPLSTTSEGLHSPNSPLPGAKSPLSPVAPVPPTPKKLRVPDPGHKFAKVRAKDGRIITVQRKISSEKIPPPEAAKATTAAPIKKAGDIQPKLDASERGNGANSSIESTKDVEKESSNTSQEASKTVVASITNIPSPAAESHPTEPTASISYDEALEEQKVRFRKGRIRRFGRSLATGVATLIGSTMPSINLDFEREGDMEVDHEDDSSHNE